MWQRIIHDKRVVGLFTILVILAAVPLTLELSNQEQDIRQRAAEPTPTVCSADQPTDTMMILDQSGSMAKATSDTDSTPRIDRAKQAANAFLDILAQRTQDPLHAASLTTISSEEYALVQTPLTRDLTKVKAAVDALVPKGGTCIECAIRNAAADFSTRQRGGVKNVGVLLTDGGATQYVGGVASTETANRREAEKRALAAAIEVHNKYKLAFYTIGFGDSINDQLLINIATSSGGKFYFAPNGSTLTQIYKNIAQIIGKGAVNGVVFNDTNTNGQLDADEDLLQGWVVNLVNPTTRAIVGTDTTDSNGNYGISGVCDGSYRVQEVVKLAWKQTSPINPDYHSVTISGANTIAEKNFGNLPQPTGSSLTCSPTNLTLTDGAVTLRATLKNSSGTPISGKQVSFAPSGNGIQLSRTSSTTDSNGIASTSITVADLKAAFNGKVTASFAGDTLSAASTCFANAQFTPQATTLQMTIFLHGIGKSGDNANPVDSSLSNKNPHHTSVPIEVTMYDTKTEPNALVADESSTATYNTTNGNYTATIQLDDTFEAGQYNLFVNSNKYLTRRIAQTLTINDQEIKTISPLSLVAGDVDNSNALNILDYDLIIGCYSDFAAPISCSQNQKDSTDINDDGKVDQFDYNLFLRELSVQNGDSIDQQDTLN